MALPTRRRTLGRKKKQEELKLYDYAGSEMTLKYVGRPASVPDSGVSRLFSKPLGSVNDNLCQLWYGEMLTGKALEDAQKICDPKPDGFILPARFIKDYSELENLSHDYP